jgi:DNA-directed RNA polymerase subunit M/transcription elongation factor TFIIS
MNPGSAGDPQVCARNDKRDSHDVRRAPDPPAGAQKRKGIDLVRERCEVPDEITKPRTCPKCGADRMRVVAKSDSPPMTFLKCEGCGYFHSTHPPALRPPDRER